MLGDEILHTRISSSLNCSLDGNKMSDEGCMMNKCPLGYGNGRGRSQ